MSQHSDANVCPNRRVIKAKLDRRAVATANQECNSQSGAQPTATDYAERKKWMDTYIQAAGPDSWECVCPVGKKPAEACVRCQDEAEKNYGLSINAVAPTASLFKDFALSQPIVLAYRLDYKGEDNATADVLLVDGTFQSGTKHEIVLSKEQYVGLKNIFIWSQSYGAGAFVTTADEPATGRLQLTRAKLKSFKDEDRSELIADFEVIKGVVVYMVEEAAINIKDKELTEIKKYLVKASKATNKEDYENEFDKAERLWIHKVHKNESGMGLLQELWYFGGGEWDYKPIIRPIWGAWQRLGNSKNIIYYDIWANLHYGFMGEKAGFSKKTLIDGANKAQGYDAGLMSKIFGKTVHDPVDDVATQEGYDLAEFSVAELLTIIARNRTYWGKEWREKLSKSEMERHKYIEAEFEKRGIPFPQGYKAIKNSNNNR